MIYYSVGFARILVCLDGSDSSFKAADLAIDVAKKHGAQLMAVNVFISQVGYAYSTGMFGLPTPSAINELLDKSKQEAEAWFDRVRAKAREQGVSVKTEVIASPTSAVPAITEYAEQNKVDLIVTGTKGRSGFKKLLLGSVASGIVTYASCPVLISK